MNRYHAPIAGIVAVLSLVPVGPARGGGADELKAHLATLRRTGERPRARRRASRAAGAGDGGHARSRGPGRDPRRRATRTPVRGRRVARHVRPEEPEVSAGEVVPPPGGDLPLGPGAELVGAMGTVPHRPRGARRGDQGPRCGHRSAAGAGGGATRGDGCLRPERPISPGAGDGRSGGVRPRGFGGASAPRGGGAEGPGAADAPRRRCKGSRTCSAASSSSGSGRPTRRGRHGRPRRGPSPRPPAASLLEVRVSLLLGQKQFDEALQALAASKVEPIAKDVLALRVRLAQRAALSGKARTEAESEAFRLARSLRDLSEAEGRRAVLGLARMVEEPDAGQGPDAWDALAEGYSALGDPSRQRPGGPRGGPGRGDRPA